VTALEALINRIATAHAIPGWVGRAIAWGESGHCWLRPATDPCWIATEPDGRQSVGPFQIHDVHGLTIQWRQNFENNTRWAMENSVGPAYRQTVALGIADRRALLAYIWRYGQRCDEDAILPAVERAMQYLERSDAEMPLDDWHSRRWISGLFRQAAGHLTAAAALADHAWNEDEYAELGHQIVTAAAKLRQAREVLRDNGLGPETGDRKLNTL